VTEDHGGTGGDEAVMADRALLAGQSIPAGHSAKHGPKHEEAVHPAQHGNGKFDPGMYSDWFVIWCGNL